ncbi:PREDICTED: uncharacterized protein LOC105365268 [Ceratosolen solmsi marchali]|uniref:Uncharacterized protein LOC105365268 n=1 Tax=Ceratosolen solmsi marchali TaxID=326594 RepID=A0AAJ6YP98_9HYME|nr:PREDICTED: uncharacterized protein LOC105365268 [Ceratosolen solmsi marchali]
MLSRAFLLLVLWSTIHAERQSDRDRNRHGRLPDSQKFFWQTSDKRIPYESKNVQQPSRSKVTPSLPERSPNRDQRHWNASVSVNINGLFDITVKPKIEVSELYNHVLMASTCIFNNITTKLPHHIAILDNVRYVISHPCISYIADVCVVVLSLFTLVRFENNVCMGVSGENGTCISPAECAQRGGLSSGICASGYGVCCIVTVSCGQSTFDNNTYFVNPSYPSTFDGTDSCQLTIIKSHSDICQFRLDFVQFNVKGPETLNNLCTYDQFIVSGGNPISPICGNNNGNHMYIDVGTGPTNPVTLSFVTSGSGFDRSWRVRIAQIPCSSIFRAEEGCMQYYTGVSGQIKSFNYDPNIGLQLSNQDYSICIRMERNFCGIQYMTCDDGSKIANPMANAMSMQQMMRSSSFTLSGNTINGQYTAMTDRSCQNDWLMMPCAGNSGRLPSSQISCVDRICGGAFNTETSVNSTSIISTVKPFRLVFHTDGTEAPNDFGNRGFCLNYVQQPCTMKLR